MSEKDPTAPERVARFHRKQIERGQKNCRVYVDAMEFERGYKLYDRNFPLILIEELPHSIDQAALVLGWRKAENEHLEKFGTRQLTQVKLDYELSQIRKLGPESVTVTLDLAGNISVGGPATPEQLRAMTKLSERVRKNGQAKN